MKIGVKEIDRERMIDYTLFEREKYRYKQDLLWRTSTIQSRLIQVTQKLKSDKNYQRFHHLLHDIEFDDFYGHQVYYELHLDDK